MGRNISGRRTQIGKETTPGVAVAGSKMLPGISFDLDVEKNVKNYKAQGYNFNTIYALQRIWMSGKFQGPLNWEEIVYPLSSLFGEPAPTTPTGGTNSRQWLFLPPGKGRTVNARTFTIEDGDEDAAEIIPNVAARSLDLNFGEDDVQVSGNVIGRFPTAGTLTANPTELPQLAAGANQIDVYMTGAGDLANLFTSGNKVTDAITEQFTMGDKVDPRFVHNTAYQSFKDLIEKAPDLKFSFMTEHNAFSRALFRAYQTDPFRYVGVRVTGPIIEGAIAYLFELTVATDTYPDKRSDSGGVYGYGYENMPKYDSALGSAFQIRVVNTRTAL